MPSAHNLHHSIAFSFRYSSWFDSPRLVANEVLTLMKVLKIIFFKEKEGKSTGPLPTD